jgi:hypothetical protein
MAKGNKPGELFGLFGGGSWKVVFTILGDFIL